MKFFFLSAAWFSLIAYAEGPLYRLPAEVSLQHREFPSWVKDCRHCHLAKQRLKMPDIKKLKRQHENYSTLHGTKNLSCNACHDANNHNYLRSTRYFPADFHNSSPVCQQCHADKFSGWVEGIHGKRLGGWNLEKVQLHCIDCHAPHSVPFKPMESIATPTRPPGSSQVMAHQEEGASH